jgi:hypothetical protein
VAKKKFKNTLFGKILGGVAKAAVAVGGVIIGGSVVKAVAGGIGNLVNSGATHKAGALDIIGEKAKQLFTGLSPDQQKILEHAKDDAKILQSKMKLAKKLMATGIDEETAKQQAGIEAGDIATASDEEVKAYKTSNKTGVQMASFGGNKTIMIAAAGLAALVLIPKLLKR